jgi:hypothetical protein
MINTNKPHNNGQWTEARKRSFIMSALRSARWPVKYASLRSAETCVKENKASGRKAKHYKCAGCEQEFVAKGVQVDHIEPIVPVTGFDSWDNTIDRLFCEEGGFQVLCKDCHAVKTKAENAERRANKKQELT